jgi:hypothetical protein
MDHMTPIEKAREQRSKKADEKREYLRHLLLEHPTASSALLLGMVQSKFGSSVSSRTLTDIRMESKKGQQSKNDAPELSGDERLEVQLVGQLQELMKRQGYKSITIPVEGIATIRMAVLVDKTPGSHVEGAYTL